MSQQKPIFILLTGPNGAGKSTYFDRIVKPIADKAGAPFINADLLEKQHWPEAQQQADYARSYAAADLASEYRAEHIRQRKSFVSETVFSHPSKLQLLREAQAGGFRTHVIFVGLSSADISVARVASRVEKGGHHVPEDKIRQRFIRTQQHILEAVAFVDRADIFDNSLGGHDHRPILQFRNGRIIQKSDKLPAWAQTLFSELLNPEAAASRQAEVLTLGYLGKQAKVRNAEALEVTVGKIIGETKAHYVQAVDEQTAVVHLKKTLNETVKVGEDVVINRANGDVLRYNQK